MMKFKRMTGKMVLGAGHPKEEMSPLKLSDDPQLSARRKLVWVARMTAGEWYCNGGFDSWKINNWQKEPCTMLLEMNPGEYGKNEEWTLKPSVISGVYTSAHVEGLGFLLPPKFTGGRIELTIYGAVTMSSTINHQSIPTPGYSHYVSMRGVNVTAITSLSLSVSQPIREEAKKETFIRRQRIDGSANETVSATVPFCTGGIAPNCGMLMRTTFTSVERVTDGTTTGTVADVLLAQYVAAYSHPSFFVRLAVAFDPVRRQGGLHKVTWRGKTFPVVSSSVDTESGVETVTLWCGEALPGVPGGSGGSAGSGDGPIGE